MKTNRLSVFLFFFALSVTSNAQEAMSTTSDTIPFELTLHNNISIAAVLNQRDTVQLMFHTAAGSMTLIKKAAEQLSSVKWDTSEEVESWGGKSEARFSENNTLQIGGFKWDSIAIWENENSGPETDGKIGPNLFTGKVMEINFDKQILILQDSLPLKINAYEKLPLIYENGFMFIVAKSRVGGKDYENRFLIHSGYGGTILYDDNFVAKSNIGEEITIIDEQELKDSYGNVLKTKKGILPKFFIGEEEFKDMPVGFFEGSIGRQKMSVLGGNLLKRFNLLISVDRANIYLKPNQLKSIPYTNS